MNLEKIQQGLLAKFEQSRLVFWHDESGEFTSVLTELTACFELAAIEVILLDDESHFAVKHRIERLAPEQKFLLYHIKPPSTPTRDWLFDVRLYATSFYADSSAMILTELKMRVEFRQDITHYKAFFSDPQRYQALKQLLPHNADKSQLELAMIAVLVKAETIDFSSILHALIVCYVDEETKAQHRLASLSEFDLAQVFWTGALERFGYLALGCWFEDKPTPSIDDLLVKLLLTDCYCGLLSAGIAVTDSAFAEQLKLHLLPLQVTESVKTQLPQSIIDILDTSGAKRVNVVSFVSYWRENRKLMDSYNQVVKLVAQRFELTQRFAEFEQPQDLLFVETFEQAEQQLLRLLATDLPRFSSIEINDWVAKRLRGHWCHVEQNYVCMYQALKAAKAFYDLRDKYIDGFDFIDAKALYTAYEQELYLFDYHYRLFWQNANQVHEKGSDILKATGLDVEIERLYVDWYLHDLAISWGKLVDQQQLLERWCIDGVNHQQQFYQHHVQTILTKPKVERVFVIISDALRYEAAHDIYQQLNQQSSQKKNFKVDIQSQLGVVPSYTQLGMASLLPHQVLTAHLSSRIAYQLDGLPTQGLANRDKILQQHQGMAVKIDKVLKWTNRQGRDNINHAKVVYIYHDVIDAIGDKAATENDTFAAVSRAVEQIVQLVLRLTQRLDGTQVLISADHGFLFKMTDVSESDKAPLKAKPKGVVEAKKRYMLGSGLPSSQDYWTGRLANTVNVDVDVGDDVEFSVPRGSNRFNFVGGAKFIHGGIMPQEICVPIVSVQVLSNKMPVEQAKVCVNVVPLNNPVKLVSNIDSIQLLQTDPVNEQFKPKRVKLWIEDEDGNKLSREEYLLFDSTSAQMDERKRSVPIKLIGSGFDRGENYKLVLLDEENHSQTSYSVTINIAFQDDFF